MKNEAVKVRREAIEKCMTCSLCNQLFTDATTICECLHTFCKECISKKLSDEEFECCPKCEADLGSVPMQKLRPDPNMQELREKIFASKKRKINTHENMPSATSIPEVSTQSPNTSNSSEGEMHIHPFVSNLMDSYGVTITHDLCRLLELDKFTDQRVEKLKAAASFDRRQIFTLLVTIASTIQALEDRCYRLSAENQKLKAELAASKAATSALSDMERRLIAKEAEVDELHKKFDNFCLGISKVEDELKKIKQSISK